MTRAGFGGAAAALGLLIVAGLTFSAVRADDSVETEAAEAIAVHDAAVASDGPTAKVARGSHGLEVEGRFRVAASHAVAWEVLTDYDGIDRFVSSMRESRIAGHGDDYVMVHQVAVGRLFLFKRRMHTTLKVHEEPPGRIRFEDVLHKDFDRYEGEWRIEDHGRDVEIIYRVEANPNVSIPDFVARGMFERTVRQLLLEVEKEIASRAAVAERQPSERSGQ